MNKLHFLLRKLIFGKKATSETYIVYLRSKGAKIGKGVKIYSPNHTSIDECFPFMLTIGDNANITHSVHILNHDFSWSVIKKQTGECLGGVGKVEIGNNVFIGVGSIILMNTKIGNNVIVGAGSVVHGEIPDNSVIAGSPAKVICSLDKYIEKRKQKQYEEAQEIAIEYKKRFGKYPPKEVMPAYFFIFEPRTNMDNPVFVSRLKLTGNYEKSLDIFNASAPLFNSYEEFLNSIEQ